MMFRQNYTSCQIDWEPEEDEQDDTEDDTNEDDSTGGDDDSDEDEPVDYDGSDYALEGHAENGTASNLIEQAITGAALRAFPNPAQSALTVVSDAQINSLQLTDLRGRTVAQWTAVDRFLTLPVADLPRGQYVLIGRTPDGVTAHRRVILH